MMSYYSGNIGDFGMDTLSLAGPLEAKLKAVREAGFTQIMVAAKDLVGHPGGLDAAVAAVRASGLRVTGFQSLRDYEGLAGHQHDFKIDIAKSMLEMCHALDCRLLLTHSSTLSYAASDASALVRDLRKLAMLAIPMNIRIAYEAIAEGCNIREFPQAGDIIGQADMPNLGLGIGSFQMFASGTSLDDLDLLDPDKIFLVQLADFMQAETPAAGQANPNQRQFRVFPGEGVHTEALASLVTRLHGMGYRGDYSFDVINDDYQQLPLPTVAQRAWRSALWLGEEVLRRSVPLPNQIRLKQSSPR